MLDYIVSPSPISFPLDSGLWILELDFGPGFWAWIWDWTWAWQFTNYERGEYFAVKLNMDQKTFLSHFYIRPLYLKCVLGPGASLTTQWRSSSSPSSTSLVLDSPLMLATVSRTLPQTQAVKLPICKLNTHKIFWALKQEVQKYFRFLIAREH